MLAYLPRTAPDSIASHKNRDGKAHVAILLNLLWSLWFFGDRMYGPTIDSAWIIATAIGFPLIVTLWLLAMTRPRRQVFFYSAAMALLGYAILPINHSGGVTCIIYACSTVAFVGSVRSSLTMMAAVVAIFVVEASELLWPWGLIVGMFSMSLAIGGGNLARRLNDEKDAEIRLSHNEVRRLAATAERERIGRDLHDLLGHTLSLIALKSELARKLFSRDTDAARREVEDVERIAREALAQVRHAVSGIRAAALAGELASARLLLECVGVRFHHAGFDAGLPEEQETCLALALREAVTNIQRHAGATQADARVVLDAGTAQLTVRDNGCGGIAVHGHGLSGMRERVTALGGTLRIESPQGLGTLLTLRLPIATNVVIMDASRDGQSTGILRAQR